MEPIDPEVERQVVAGLAWNLDCQARRAAACLEAGRRCLEQLAFVAKGLLEERAALEHASVAREQVLLRDDVRQKALACLTPRPRAYLAECHIVTQARRTVKEQRQDPDNVTFLLPLKALRHRLAPVKHCEPWPGLTARPAAAGQLEFERDKHQGEVREKLSAIREVQEQLVDAQARTKELLAPLEESRSTVVGLHRACEEFASARRPSERAATASGAGAITLRPNGAVDRWPSTQAMEVAKERERSLAGHVEISQALVEKVRALRQQSFASALAHPDRWAVHFAASRGGPGSPMAATAPAGWRPATAPAGWRPAMREAVAGQGTPRGLLPSVPSTPRRLPPMAAAQSLTKTSTIEMWTPRARPGTAPPAPETHAATGRSVSVADSSATSVGAVLVEGV